MEFLIYLIICMYVALPFFVLLELRKLTQILKLLQKIRKKL